MKFSLGNETDFVAHMIIFLAQIVANGSFNLRKRLNLLIDVLTRKYRHMPSRLAYHRVLDDPFSKIRRPKNTNFRREFGGFCNIYKVVNKKITELKTDILLNSTPYSGSGSYVFA